MYLSFKYYYDDQVVCDINIDKENDICFICWIPSSTNNKIKYLSDFGNIRKECKCNPKLHSQCLEDWIKHTLTCPICRKTLTTNKNIFVDFNISCIKHTVCFFKFISYFFMLISNISSIFKITKPGF